MKKIVLFIAVTIVTMEAGRRTFLPNLGKKADEPGIKEMVNQAGHTTLGYMNDNSQRKVKEGLGFIT